LDITLGLLLKRAGIEWRYEELEGIAEIVWPPICGRHLMQINHQQTAGEKRLAMRHGLSHVLAGDVSDFCSHRDHHWSTHEESVADLFALADLVPDRELGNLRTAGYSLDEVRHWIWCEIKRYAPDWPSERVDDRVHLRVLL
jgi:hypothetical protein